MWDGYGFLVSIVVVVVCCGLLCFGCTKSLIVKVFNRGFLFSSFLQESFDGQMTEDNIEIGVASSDGFRLLGPAEVKDYLAAIQ